MGRLVKAPERYSKEEFTILLAAVGNRVTTAEIRILLNSYSALTVKRSEPTGRRLDDSKAWAISKAIYRVCGPEHLPLLRRALRTMRLSPSIRPLILGLLACGTMKDFELLLECVARADAKVDLWNHIQIGHAAASLTRRACGGMPKSLEAYLKRNEFWIYLLRKHRQKAAAKDRLPIEFSDNRALFVRLVAYGLIGAASARDKAVLVRLSTHEYSQIARAAAMRLADLLGENALNVLAQEIDVRIRAGDLNPFAYALRYGEMRVFDVA